jgi:ribosomal protein S27E
LLLSCRVLAPPGGKSNINLFGGTDSSNETSKPVNTCQAARQQSHVFESAQSNVKVNPCQAKRQESHVFDKAAGEQRSMHTSSKVLKAPGGGSSITFD